MSQIMLLSELAEDVSSVYINMIRDPIDRFESFYYFSRFGNVKGGGGKAKLSEIQKLETVDQCVERRRKECIQPVWQVVPYLCGSAPVCQERSRDALERAKVSHFQTSTKASFPIPKNNVTIKCCRIFEKYIKITFS